MRRVSRSGSASRPRPPTRAVRDCSAMTETAPVLAPRSAAQIRAELIELVERDLHGPAAGENELLPQGESPRDRYLVGLIAPRGRVVEPETDEPLRAAEESGEDGVPEDEPAQESLFPSSVGMSFRIDGECERVRVSATWGRYERVANPDGEGRVWQRQPAGGELTLELAPGAVEVGAPDPDVPNVRIEAVVRRLGSQWSVTLFLRNEQSEPSENRDRAWLFQAQLAVEPVDGSAAFVARTEPGGDDDEQGRLAVAYRRRIEHAVGHNVAIHAVLAEDDPTRAVRIKTSALPRHEVAQMRPPTAKDEPLLAGLELDMERLGTAADGELPALLEPLVHAYRDWLERQRRRLDAGEDRLEQ